MSEQEPKLNTADVFEAWKGMRDAYLESWSKALVEGVNSEAYAQASGVMLDAYLTASAPFRQAMEKMMVQALQQLSMPTRADVTSLAERMTNVEMRLDDLDAKLDRIESLLTLQATKANGVARKAKTKKKTR